MFRSTVTRWADIKPGCNPPDDGRCQHASVPNQPKTPNRTFRIPDAIFDPAREKARREGTTLSEVVKAALLDYVADPDWWSIPE